MTPLDNTAFDASPSNYDTIQSELDHWKNLIFSFDICDEQPPPDSNPHEHGTRSKDLRDAVLLAQIAEASRSLELSHGISTGSASPPNLPLHPSLMALVQALQSVPTGAGFQALHDPGSQPSNQINVLSLTQLLQQSAAYPFFTNSQQAHLDSRSSDFNTMNPAFSSSVNSSVSLSANNVDDTLDDKRQRNTAASARFRIKKKQRILNLERSVSDLAGRADELEREASNLRRENGWLKEIIILKSRLQLTPDTVSLSMWVDEATGPGGDHSGDQGASDSEYTEDQKRKGKSKGIGKGMK